MAVIEIALIQVRRGQELQTGIPNLEPGEFGWAQDTENLYIGKRIDEGAVSDQPTRVLVERDLDLFKSLALNTGTVSASYKYRDGVSALDTYTTVTTIQSKLDSFSPSLTDFGLAISTLTNEVYDITSTLSSAIAALYQNENLTTRADLRRQLRIPAGNFTINNTIDLPPYTSIIGEGPEMTKVVFVNTASSLFRTVDADGNRFEDTMQSGSRRARDVSIEGITFEYSTATLSNNPLIQLDNVLNPRIHNCVFRTQIDSTSTTTYGLVNSGIGIGIRGTGGGSGAGNVSLCENISITNCTFDSLGIAVEAIGSVVRSVIDSNLFSNLYQGIKLHATDAGLGPSGAVINQNRFENIVNEGIFVGTSVVGQKTNHYSSNNYFYQVGNGTDLNDYTRVTSTTTAVISFGTEGNISRDDVFNRRIVANETTGTDFYYFPVVEGKTVVSDPAVYSKSLTPNATTQLLKLPVSGSDQKVDVSYQMTGAGLSRKGQILVNIAPDGFASLTDNYNYSQTLVTTGTVFVPDLDNSSVNLLVVSSTVTSGLSIVPDVFYVVGIGAFAGFTAIVKSINTSDPDFTVIETESSNPEFDFRIPEGSYQFAYGDFVLPDFNVNSDVLYTNKGYVVLECRNTSQAFAFDVDIQVDTQQ